MTSTVSPALVLIFVWVMLWIMMDVHLKDLSPIQRWLAPVLIIITAVGNHLLRSLVGNGIYMKLMFLTMHLPFFLIFLWITRCGVIKMAFMILSAVIFTTPTVITGNIISILLPGNSMALLVCNLVSYAAVIALVWFVFRKGFGYLLRYGDNHLFLVLSIVPLLYYIYAFALLSTGRPLLDTTEHMITRYLPTMEVFVFYFLLLGIYKGMSERRELEVAQTALAGELDAAEEQIALLNKAQTQTAVYQHDMRHHLNMLEGLLDGGNVEGAREYIRQVQAGVEAITPKRFCENELVNLMCSSFAGKAEQSGIRLDISAKLPEELAISDTELCSVLSNGLENALNAAKKMDGQERWASLYCGVKLNKLLVEIKNPCPEKIVFRDGLPVSSKPGHGYGCRSIKTITERRGGICGFRVRDGVFTLQLMFPVRTGQEKVEKNEG